MKIANRQKYEQIFRDNARTQLSLRSLCAAAGVSYQSYRYWVKKYSPLAGVMETSPQPTDVVSVRLPTDRIIQCILEQKKEIHLSLSEALGSLTPEQAKVIFEVRGRLEIERYLKAIDQTIKETDKARLYTGNA